MAFQAHVLENGQWVSRTTNIQSLLQNGNNGANAKADVPYEAPRCGIMSRTVVQSPVAHWVLAVRLRSSHNTDIAFIGDHYVQISELRPDGQLHHINRKCDFGSRIRNAKVIGVGPVIVSGQEHTATGFPSRPVNAPIDPDDLPDLDPFVPTPTPPLQGLSSSSSPSSSSSSSSLPPQLLLIVLETGDCVFLFLRETTESHQYEFVAVHHPVNSSRLVRPGFHLAVDPSSRYVAQACSRNMFVIHELEPMHRLNDAYARGKPLKPIVSTRPRTVNGVIHTIEFLYPRPQDPQHIILLLIVVRDGVSRMVTYDWELGDDLRRVFAGETNGHVLPPQHEMPLMVIPLTVRSAFFAVSDTEIAYCADILQGSPSFEPCEVSNFPPSEQHDGTDQPLWTAWSRPPRMYPFHRDKDFIYVAREDGVVIYLECDTEDILGAAFYHGTFCNVSTAFASLPDDNNGETLVFGGDGGQGGVWRAIPREEITKLCRIPNWSPTVDFVTTHESSRWDNFNGATGKTSRAKRQDVGSSSSDESPGFFKPDKIYAAAGRASHGSIVEFRYGLQANIGIEFDFGAVIKRCFMFQENTLDPDSGYYLLLSVPGKSVLLCFDSKFSSHSTTELEQAQTPFDLSSPTLIATTVYEGVSLQVSERGIVYECISQSAKFSFASLGLGDAVVTEATLQDNILAVTSHTGSVFQLHIIKLDILKLGAQYLYTESFTDGDVTSFCLFPMAGKIYAATSLWFNKSVCLDVYNVTDRVREKTMSLSSLIGATGSSFANEPYTSILSTFDKALEQNILVAGSRDGYLITMNLATSDGGDLTGSVSCEKMSPMPVHVYPTREAGSVFVCCDSNFILADQFRDGQGLSRKRSVWTVDAEDSSKPSPSITSVSALTKSLSGNEANMPLLLLANDRILLAELQPQLGPVQRHLPLGVTPVKILYSHVLKCLVVAAKTSDNKPILKFIDPETGNDISQPVHGSTKEPVEFINGLGQQGDRILCLDEWHVESDSGHGHYFILVSTRGSRAEDGGKILIISTKAEKPPSGQQTRGKIRFWTRYKLKRHEDDVPGPISAVTAHGHKIQSSMGTKIQFHELDEAEKKIIRAPSQDIGGPAWKLSMLPGCDRTIALIKGDSIRVLEQEGDEIAIPHVGHTTRSNMDMLEVAGAWPAGPNSLPAPQEPSDASKEPPESLVLLSDQSCGLSGLWIPWKKRGHDCETVFEADLPSSVRRLRLGRTLPPWSRATRRHVKRFGHLAASVDDAEILGMGIDGSLQHFTLLDLSVWRLLRLVQNVAETSQELYPFTYLPLGDEDGDEVMGDEDSDAEGFDPTPEVDRGMEMQIDGDLMLRCLEKRALERLMAKREAWMDMFVEFLDGVDGGRWTEAFRKKKEDGDEFDDDEDDDYDDIMLEDGQEKKDRRTGKEDRARRYFELAYEILEYFLVPVL